MGVVIAMWITDFENFGTIQNFITLPLYMFSGAIFPTRQVPPWLHVILLLNPLTYGVNAIRGVLLGYEIDTVPFNLALLLAFTMVMLVIAIWMSRREV
jgi:ABC-2 type transport system permease protein